MIATTIDSLTDVIEKIEKENEPFKGSLQIAIAALQICQAQADDQKTIDRLQRAIDDIEGQISDFF